MMFRRSQKLAGPAAIVSPAAKYRALRRVLVWLRRWSLRYSVNFDNAAESSRKDVSPGAVVSKKPIPPEDLERARQYVRDRGWVRGE